MLSVVLRRKVWKFRGAFQGVCFWDLDPAFGWSPCLCTFLPRDFGCHSGAVPASERRVLVPSQVAGRPR